MDEKIQEIINYFPDNLKNKLIRHLLKYNFEIQEIRLRINKPVCLSVAYDNVYLKDVVVDKAELEYIFNCICEHSVYSHQDEINSGFITVNGGNRVGICGTAVFESGKIISVKNISSLNFRIARDFYGCAEKILDNNIENIIIAGPPSSGKTTLLRDIAREYSNRNKKVCVVDERFEISGYNNEFDLGVMTDCLKGYKKADGISLSIRTLSPQVIIFDEIGTMDECKRVFNCLNSGVCIVTSVHCYEKKQFFSRPLCKYLIGSGFFDKTVFLGKQAGKVVEILKMDSEKICV